MQRATITMTDANGKIVDKATELQFEDDADLGIILYSMLGQLRDDMWECERCGALVAFDLEKPKLDLGEGRYACVGCESAGE
ncbi:MAG: hypothetical protein H6818_22620 [Phycisphaerales bacterium]|nr:hypothetical protein [Phycisphaerales bacterium]